MCKFSHESHRKMKSSTWMSEYEKLFLFQFSLTATHSFFSSSSVSCMRCSISRYNSISHTVKMINSITSILPLHEEANAFFHLRMWVVEIFFLPNHHHHTHITVACEKWWRKILQQWFNLYLVVCEAYVNDDGL